MRKTIIVLGLLVGIVMAFASDPQQYIYKDITDTTLLYEISDNYAHSISIQIDSVSGSGDIYPVISPKNDTILMETFTGDPLTVTGAVKKTWQDSYCPTKYVGVKIPSGLTLKRATIIVTVNRRR